MVIKGQFWVVLSVVKTGSFGRLLVWLKRRSSWGLLGCLKKGSFEWLLGWLKRGTFG